MKTNNILKHAASLPGAVEEYPFGPEALVFKVRGKMFALLTEDEKPPRITLKCKPDNAVQLCDQYSSVSPGYYMNKKHWITINLDGEISESSVIQFLDDSYNLVVNKLSKKEKELLYA